MTRNSIASAVILLPFFAGCAAPGWSKQGATLQDLESDRAVCNSKAQALYPQNVQLMSVGWDSPPRRECSGGGGGDKPICINVPGVPAAPRMLDANETSRQKAVEACLKAMGWSK